MKTAYYFTEKTELGKAFVAASDRGLLLVDLGGNERRGITRLKNAGYEPVRDRERLSKPIAELKAYASGKTESFNFKIDPALMTSFQETVLTELTGVGYGETETYGGLARRIGKPKAARAVGGALNRNPIPIFVPCHRVVGSDGSLVGFAGGIEKKQELLALEQHGSQARA